MNIMVSANKKYLFPAKAMLKSLSANCDEFLEVYFITERDMIDKENLSKFERFVSKECNGSLHIIYIDIDEKLKKVLTDSLQNPNIFPLMVYNCILGLFFLPETIDRILYLDSDMINIGDMSQLYYQDFEDNMLCAVEEPDNSHTRWRKSELKLGKEHRCINSGLLLYNVRKIRSQLSLNSIYECAISHVEKLFYPDQDLINCLFTGKFKLCDSKRYNVRIRSTSKISSFELLSGEAVNIHFLGSEKPWNKGFENDAYKIFWKYAKNVNIFRYIIFLISNLLWKMKSRMLKRLSYAGNKQQQLS